MLGRNNTQISKKKKKDLHEMKTGKKMCGEEHWGKERGT
jgi:hypothetical protein